MESSVSGAMRKFTAASPHAGQASTTHLGARSGKTYAMHEMRRAAITRTARRLLKSYAFAA